MAERVGFEPTAHCCVTGFQDQLLKPLGHLSEYRLQSRILSYHTGSGLSIDFRRNLKMKQINLLATA